MYKGLFQQLKQKYPDETQLEQIIKEIDNVLPDETKDTIIIPEIVLGGKRIQRNEFYKDCNNGIREINPEVLELYKTWVTEQYINSAATNTLNQVSNLPNSRQMIGQRPAIEAAAQPNITDTIKGYLGLGGKKSRRGKKRRRGRQTKKGRKRKSAKKRR